MVIDALKNSAATEKMCIRDSPYCVKMTRKIT